MRDLKFRVWDSDNNWYMEKELTKVVFKGDEEPDIIYDGELLLAPNNVIVEQFTGLKDSQGKDIYEGDILEWDEDGEVLRDTVIYFGHDKYSAPYPAFDFNQNKYTYVFPFAWMALTRPDFHVVGNIHENADLLEDA